MFPIRKLTLEFFVHVVSDWPRGVYRYIYFTRDPCPNLVGSINLTVGRGHLHINVTLSPKLPDAAYFRNWMSESFEVSPWASKLFSFEWKQRGIFTGIFNRKCLNLMESCRCLRFGAIIVVLQVSYFGIYLFLLIFWADVLFYTIYNCSGSFTFTFQFLNRVISLLWRTRYYDGNFSICFNQVANWLASQCGRM